MFWIVEVYKKYATFSGRAHRREYWTFALFNLLVLLSCGYGVYFSQGREELHVFFILLYNLWSLGSFLPSLAVAVRRIHDSNNSGWLVLFPIVNFIFLLLDGTPGPNKYGPDPKGRTLQENR